MTRFSTAFISGCVFLVSACGSSSSGKSSDKKECKTTNTANANLPFIRIPGGNTPPATNNPVPGVPATPEDDELPTEPKADDCVPATTNPGNLGDAPGTPNTRNPVANNPTTGPTMPGSTTPPMGGNRGPGMDVTSILGEWDFQAVYCENGTITPVLQKLNEMRMNDELYITLKISRTSIEEFRWVKIQDTTNNSTMMCTLKQMSTYASNGPTGFRVSTTAASYEDAGGTVQCNLGSEPAAVLDQVGLFAGGDALVRTVPKAAECNGMTMIQSFEKRRN